MSTSLECTVTSSMRQTATFASSEQACRGGRRSARKSRSVLVSRQPSASVIVKRLPHIAPDAIRIEIDCRYSTTGLTSIPGRAYEMTREQLITELRQSLDNVNKLAGLMQFCSTCQMNLTLPAVPSSILTVSEGVTQMLTDKGWKEDDIIKVDLALQEALANGIRHGAKNDPSKFIQCVVTTDTNGDLVIVVRDPGPGFNPAAVPNPLEGDNILKASGRGVFLINQLMDEVTFTDSGREVQMKKRKDS